MLATLPISVLGLIAGVVLIVIGTSRMLTVGDDDLPSPEGE
jgi:hypothetical protein